MLKFLHEFGHDKYLKFPGGVQKYFKNTPEKICRNEAG